MYELPLKKQKVILSEFKSFGQKWIDEYPSLMTDCVERWGLKLLGTASAGLPINVIHYAETGTGQPVVLKVGVPHPEQKTELRTLRYYEGRHAVRVIDWDDESGAFLMDRITPGTNLREYDFVADGGVEARSEIKIQLMNELPIAASDIDDLPTIDEWLALAFNSFRKKTKDNPEFLGFIVLAESLYVDIKAMYPGTFLLHGDLHHENILHDAERGWLAIDPKGVLGPKIMECGRFIQNFIEDEVSGADSLDDATDDEVKSILNQRLEVFHDVTGYDRNHLAMVTFIDQVLSSCWTVNSGRAVDQRKIRLIRDLVKTT